MQSDWKTQDTIYKMSPCQTNASICSFQSCTLLLVDCCCYTMREGKRPHWTLSRASVNTCVSSHFDNNNHGLDDHVKLLSKISYLFIRTVENMESSDRISFIHLNWPWELAQHCSESVKIQLPVLAPIHIYGDNKPLINQKQHVFFEYSSMDGNSECFIYCRTMHKWTPDTLSKDSYHIKAFPTTHPQNYLLLRAPDFQL